jgi:acetyltransferase-like isoleucine patch superfamily enzyme
MKIIGGRYRDEAELRGLGVECGSNVMVHDSAILVDADNIALGSNVRIDPFCILSAAGGHIAIGDYVHIAAHACIFGAGGVIMQDFSGISQSVKIYSASDDYSGASLTNPTIPKEYLRTIRGEVALGRHVIIGAGSVILPGVSIGEGSAVGALSLVTKSLAEWAIYCGAPARRIKARHAFPLEEEARMLKNLEDMEGIRAS